MEYKAAIVIIFVILAGFAVYLGVQCLVLLRANRLLEAQCDRLEAKYDDLAERIPYIFEYYRQK